MKKYLFIIILLIITGVSIYIYFGAPKAQQNLQVSKPELPKPLELKAQKLKAQDLVIWEDMPGRTTAFEMTEIRPQVSGIIKKIMFDEGSFVKEGAQLYQIDQARYRAAYNMSMANLEKVKANYKLSKIKYARYKKLMNDKAISTEEYDEASTTLEQALADIDISKASAEQSKIELEYTELYAPISGIIGKSSVTRGDLVIKNQSETLATITRLDPIFVDMVTSSTNLIKLKNQNFNLEDSAIKLYVDGQDKPYEHEGKILFQDVIVEETTGSIKLRAIFKNQDNFLIPGLFVQAKLKLLYKGIFLVPQKAAIRKDNGNLQVWLIGENNQVKATEVKALRADNGNWLVTDGLKENDILVTEGILKLKEGITILPSFKNKL